MSGRFGVLKPQPAPTAVLAPPPPAETQPAIVAKPARQDRAGKKMVGGHFSAELSRAVNILSAEQDMTVQALMGEAIDDLLRKYGKHPFGER
jgi:hypothetical protein